MVAIDGSLVLLANRFRISRYVSPYFRAVLLNSLSFGFRLFFMMWVCIACIRLTGIFSILALPCLAVVGLTVLWFGSTFLTFRLCNSMGLSPVSLLIQSLSDNVFPAAAISLVNCCSVGRFGIFSSGL